MQPKASSKPGKMQRIGKKEFYMLNNFCCVGRLTSDLEIIEAENGSKFANVIIAVPRNYKNENGEYDTDLIPCTLWRAIADNTAEYCKKGDIVGVKGRMQMNENKLELVAEKVTFLSSKKAEESTD